MIVNSLEVVLKGLLDFLVKTAHASCVDNNHRTLDFIMNYDVVKCYKQMELWIMEILDLLLNRHGDTVLGIDSILTLCSNKYRRLSASKLVHCINHDTSSRMSSRLLEQMLQYRGTGGLCLISHHRDQ